MRRVFHAFKLSSRGHWPVGALLRNALRAAAGTAFFLCPLSLSAEAISASQLKSLVDLCIDQTDILLEHTVVQPKDLDVLGLTPVVPVETAQFSAAAIQLMLGTPTAIVFSRQSSKKTQNLFIDLMYRTMRNEDTGERVGSLASKYIALNEKHNSDEPRSLSSPWFKGAWWLASRAPVIIGVAPYGLCSVYGLSDKEIESFVGRADWNFKSHEIRGVKQLRFLKRATARTPRVVARMVTGIGHNHRLPNALVELTRYPDDLPRPEGVGPWVLSIKDATMEASF